MDHISPGQLDQWMRDLDQRIAILEERIRPLQAELADLQRQRSLVSQLRQTTRKDGGETSVSSTPTTGAARRPLTSPLPAAVGRSHNGHAPYTAYRKPLLESMIELGGKSTAEEVLQRMKAKMEPIFTPKDFEILPSGVEERWRNTARWTRKALVDQGLLRNDSPRGIWEISERGKEWLKQNLH